MCLWVHPINERRLELGIFSHMYHSLLQDKVRFIKYFITGLKHLLKMLLRKELKVKYELLSGHWQELPYASHNVQSET